MSDDSRVNELLQAARMVDTWPMAIIMLQQAIEKFSANVSNAAELENRCHSVFVEQDETPKRCTLEVGHHGMCLTPNDIWF